MSHHNHKDYTKYSSKPMQERDTTVEEKEIFCASEGVAEPETFTVADEPTPEEPTPVVEPKVAAEGVVAGCKKLNVREHPDKNAKVVCVLDEGAVVEVFTEESVGDFYKVCTEIGIEGYCMKAYIELA